MLNIKSAVTKTQYHASLIRQMKALEYTCYVRVKPVLGQCYLSSARMLELGISNVKPIVDNQMPRIRQILMDHYKRVGNIFSNIVFKALEDGVKNIYPAEIKSLKDEWWRAFSNWVLVQAAAKVTYISNTTKRLIATVIDKGVHAGKSYKNIAKDLRKVKNITNPYRASMIARTETHSGMSKSMNQAMRSSRVEYEREWSSTKDERTRINHLVADGERIGKDDKYVKTGEPLDFPGDPKGSAGNIIHCRCVELFHVVNRFYGKEKPLVPKVVPPKVHPKIVSIDKWEKTEDVEKLKKEFNKVGIREVTPHLYKNKKEKLKIMNETGEELIRLKNEYPALKSFMDKKDKEITLKELHVYNTRPLPEKVSRHKALGVYESNPIYKDVTKLHVSGALKDKTELNIGNQLSEYYAVVCTEDYKGVLRHEFGHHFFNKELDKQTRLKWTQLYMSKKRENSYYWKDEISVYANTNVNESFAESFTAYTSPLYGKKRLPKDVEKFMEELVGKRKK